MAYSFPRGETIAVIAQVVAGDPTIVTSQTAALRPSMPTDPTQVDPSQAAAASFTVSLNAAASDGSYPAFWLLLMSASTSAGLAIGTYLADLRLNFADGSVWISPPIQITITEPATTA